MGFSEDLPVYIKVLVDVLCPPVNRLGEIHRCNFPKWRLTHFARTMSVVKVMVDAQPKKHFELFRSTTLDPGDLPEKNHAIFFRPKKKRVS